MRSKSIVDGSTDGRTTRSLAARYACADSPRTIVNVSSVLKVRTQCDWPRFVRPSVVHGNGRARTVDAVDREHCTKHEAVQAATQRT